MMRDSEILEVARRILNERLASKNLIGCDVKSEDDFDGQSVIRVRARAHSAIKDAAERLDATTAIRDALMSRGDDRFVYLSFDISGDEEATSDEEDAGDEAQGGPQQ